MHPQDFIALYEKALATQNWQSVEPLMHPEVVVVFSTGSIHTGIEEVKVAYKRNFQAIKQELFKISNVQWTLEDETKAHYTFHFEWSGIVNGKLLSGSGKGKSELVFESGKWLLKREELSS